MVPAALMFLGIIFNMLVRKKRKDRNYILYQLTAEHETYIGLTVAQGQAFLRSVKVRIQKHISRAKKENKNWLLYTFIRDNPEVTLQYEVLEVIRGRKNAYQRERELITENNPSLNTF
jgi:sarcosine oxidase delta subunit